ncbi:MAG: hypothetical protein HC824_19545, partial [Synechococcales cyanobacterium RM1_1_8]|nr:hypothetical protein [Synechococcales cyanobacterium RM1_1_8]
MGSNNLGKNLGNNLGKNNQAQLHRWLIGALATVLGTASAAWAAPTQILKDSLAQPIDIPGHVRRSRQQRMRRNPSPAQPGATAH